MKTATQKHWNAVYKDTDELRLGWYEPSPDVSMQLIHAAHLPASAAIIDIGSGVSRLADALLDAGFENLSLLDVSAQALQRMQQRLASRAEGLTWIVHDVTTWHVAETYDLWHDRAVFHFLTQPEPRAAYIRRLKAALEPGATAVIGTFALDGPDTCSGLPVQRYSPESLSDTLGPGFAREQSLTHVHTTPGGKSQPYQFSRFRRL